MNTQEKTFEQYNNEMKYKLKKEKEINLILDDEKKSESIKTTRKIPLVQREVQGTIHTTANNLILFIFD